MPLIVHQHVASDLDPISQNSGNNSFRRPCLLHDVAFRHYRTDNVFNEKVKRNMSYKVMRKWHMWLTPGTSVSFTHKLVAVIEMKISWLRLYTSMENQELTDSHFVFSFCHIIAMVLSIIAICYFLCILQYMKLYTMWRLAVEFFSNFAIHPSSFDGSQ